MHFALVDDLTPADITTTFRVYFRQFFSWLVDLRRILPVAEKYCATKEVLDWLLQDAQKYHSFILEDRKLCGLIIEFLRVDDISTLLVQGRPDQEKAQLWQIMQALCGAWGNYGLSFADCHVPKNAIPYFAQF